MSISFIFKTPKKMQCRYIKQDGSECHAFTIEGSEFCWFHALECDYARRDAQSKGGKAYRTGIYAELPVLNLKTIHDVPELLMDTIRQLRAGFIGPRIAATTGYLSGMLIKSLEAGETDKRLKKLEQKTNEIMNVIKNELEKNEDFIAYSKNN
jgi:hypothetical protein